MQFAQSGKMQFTAHSKRLHKNDQRLTTTKNKNNKNREKDD